MNIYVISYVSTNKTKQLILCLPPPSCQIHQLSYPDKAYILDYVIFWLNEKYEVYLNIFVVSFSMKPNSKILSVSIGWVKVKNKS